MTNKDNNENINQEENNLLNHKETHSEENLDVISKSDDSLENNINLDESSSSKNDTSEDKVDSEEVQLMQKNQEKIHEADKTDEEKADESKIITEKIENNEDKLDPIVNNETALEIVEDKKLHEEDKPKEKNSKLRLFIYAFAVITSCIIAYFIYNYLTLKKYERVLNVDTYYNGIYVDDIHLGGLTLEEALDKITSQQSENEAEIKVTIITDSDEYVFTAKDIDIIYDTDEVLSRAYEVGRSGTLKSRYAEVMELETNTRKFGTYRTEDPTPIKEKLDEIAAAIEQAATEPQVLFVPDGNADKSTWFEYTDPVLGTGVDKDKLWDMVLLEFQDRTYGSIEVPTYEIEPVSNVDLRDLTQEIVSFKSIQARNTNRQHNIALACSMINGTVLMPGEEFSMNDTTGERTKEKGFKEANTIVGGNELVPGIAGGVCQVSGTLFNAVVRADLEITERYHHSFELGYLSRGRDATVNYGTADLKFVNNMDTPIYIAMYTVGLEVYAEIYGAPLTNCAYIDLWVKTIDTTPIGEAIVVKDSTVAKGSEPKLLAGHQGIVCEAYKIYRNEKGEQIASELLYTDVYKYYAPEIHIHPDDYEAYVNPTPNPTATATPEPTPSAPSRSRGRSSQ